MEHYQQHYNPTPYTVQVVDTIDLLLPGDDVVTVRHAIINGEDYFAVNDVAAAIGYVYTAYLRRQAVDRFHLSYGTHNLTFASLEECIKMVASRQKYKGVVNEDAVAVTQYLTAIRPKKADERE